MATKINMLGFHVVVAFERGMGISIGRDGKVPWELPREVAYFRELTARTRDPRKRNAVIMGRKTYDRFRPLQGRVNVVLGTVAPGLPVNVMLAGSLEHAMALLSDDEDIETVFVAGGARVYEEAMKSPLCQAVHVTHVDASYACDAFFPAIDLERFRIWSAAEPQEEKGVRYTLACYTPDAAACPNVLMPPAMASKHDELQYLDLVDRIIRTGTYRPDRTGTGTYSLFGTSMRFNLRHTFPLLTTKRVFWRGVLEELLWFVRGETDAKLLQDKGVHIWDGNSSREYLDSIGLTEREAGDLGPVYGFQWRHFGAEYTDRHRDYAGEGVDQLADVIDKLKTDPTSRRIVMTAWNPAALRLMALPPCHMFCQFYAADGELSCLMYQRSCDVGLGVPFNIASYAALTLMIAQVCGLRPGEFVHVMGDTHVYSNHVEPLREQLRNAPLHFPTLKINPAKRDIESFSSEDFELVGYRAHNKIDMKMAV
jgi:dihydrofolate reductase/thymidylate synthase